MYKELLLETVTVRTWWVSSMKLARKSLSSCAMDIGPPRTGFLCQPLPLPYKRLASAFRFDFAGNGESDGSYQYGNYRREAEDLRAVIEYFCRKQRMIAAIVGHSKGGNVALLYASKYNDIPMVVNLSGRFNLNRSLEYHLGNNFLYRIRQDGFIDVMTKRGTYRVTEESLLDRITTDTRATSQLIHEDCRVLSVHGSKDELVPQEDALEFAKIIRNHKLHIVEGADHEYTRHQKELVSVVLGFISEGLKQGRYQPLHFTSKI